MPWRASFLGIQNMHRTCCVRACFLSLVSPSPPVLRACMHANRPSLMVPREEEAHILGVLCLKSLVSHEPGRARRRADSFIPIMVRCMHVHVFARVLISRQFDTARTRKTDGLFSCSGVKKVPKDHRWWESGRGTLRPSHDTAGKYRCVDCQPLLVDLFFVLFNGYSKVSLN